MNIIENLYYGNLCEYDRKLDKDLLQIETDAYDEMKEKLPPEYFEIVKVYLEKSADYTDKLCTLRYKRGFQAGMLLAFETIKFDI